MPTTTVPRSRFQELVAKKRAEREAKEQAEREKAQADRKQEAEKQKKLAKQYKEIYSSEMDDGMTEDAQKVLEESSRPAQRKASKKALEEMNHETQRMARNQQLTSSPREDEDHDFGFCQELWNGSALTLMIDHRVAVLSFRLRTRAMFLKTLHQAVHAHTFSGRKKNAWCNGHNMIMFRL
jgi:transketolase